MKLNGLEQQQMSTPMLYRVARCADLKDVQEYVGTDDTIASHYKRAEYYDAQTWLPTDTPQQVEDKNNSIFSLSTFFVRHAIDAIIKSKDQFNKIDNVERWDMAERIAKRYGKYILNDIKAFAEMFIAGDLGDVKSVDTKTIMDKLKVYDEMRTKMLAPSPYQSYDEPTRRTRDTSGIFRPTTEDWHRVTMSAMGVLTQVEQYARDLWVSKNWDLYREGMQSGDMKEFYQHRNAGWMEHIEEAKQLMYGPA